MRTPFIFLFCCLPLLAQPPIPRYEVKWTPDRILIDGKLDDPAWKAASTIELGFPWDFQTGEKQRTVVRLLWDDANLYVGYDCDDVDIVALRTERDDPTYLDDAVEIFINPAAAQTEVYYGLEMNARAVLYDYLMVNAAHVFKRFNMGGVQLVSYLRGTLNTRGDKDNGWSLELAVPWENFGVMSKRPEAGDVWKANLNRWDGVEPNRRLSIWSNPLQKRPNPHVPARFGELVFTKDAN